MHLNVGPEIEGGAASLARFLQTIQGGYHEIVDDKTFLIEARPDQCVYGASGMNGDGYHICVIGNVQTAQQWADTYSRGELDLAARRVAQRCHDFGIPPTQLTDAQVADPNTRGICDHWAVNRAIVLPAVARGDHSMGPGDHTDVGPGFPWPSFMAAVDRNYCASPVPVPPEEPVHILVRSNHAPASDHFVGVDIDTVAETVTLVGPNASFNPSPAVMKGKHWRGLPVQVANDPLDEVTQVRIVTEPDNFEYLFRVGP